MGNPSRRHGGYSLIEILVALVVLSIGMLGVAGMFTSALKDSRSAFYRNKATTLARDMAERIRANPEGATSYAATLDATGTNGGCSTTDSNTAAPCTAAAMASHDIFEWKQALAAVNRGGVPSGQGSIVRDTSTTPPQFTITVQWSEGFDHNGTAATQQVVLVTQL